VRELGLAREVEVTADLAFLLPAPKEDEIAAARRLVGLPEEAGPVAAIALRPSPAEGPRDLASRLGAAIGGACDELRLKPVLLAMQCSQDLGFARSAAAAMPVEAVIAPPMSARQLLALTAGCDLVIGMRLHALIFGALAGVPLVGISYDPKVDGLMEQLGLAAATSVERLDDSALSRSIVEAWQRRGEMARPLADRAERLRAMALRNVELALSALPRQGQ
jgi:polysaccharide pyruvyl transferase WcaK-like protein